MEPDTAKLATYKRIIVCADGTWLASNLGDSSKPSNVARIARALAQTGIDEDGFKVEQIVYYQSGLGSGDLPLQKAIYGGLGWGLDNDICQAYEFIANNYEPGDELFFFGFSRGAFTARSVAGLVCDVGVISPVHMSRFSEMWQAYRQNISGRPFRLSTWYLDHHKELGLSDVTVKVIGVWDTVGALGIPELGFVKWLTKVGIPINKEYTFHNTNLSERVDYAFQALAIDEQRLTFPPTLWHKTAHSPAKELQQCWFPGVHGNIGGQAESRPTAGDYGEIGDNTFAWMVDNVSRMLTFQQFAINTVVEEHRLAMDRLTISWGCGPIVSDFSGIQGAFFRLLGKQDRTPGGYPRDPGDGTDGATNEYFHPMVRIREEKVRSWDPVPIRGWKPQPPNEDRGWQWVKEGVHSLPEYVMCPEKVMSLAYDDAGVTKFKSGRSLSRILCPTDILMQIDRENGLDANGDKSKTSL
ncbi:hypothetical protein N5P37_005702 [Trichoderma harzianum]|uniref:T6SS Phospholipase effector Tle1-like catalytic domain-containing protein n=1 Tax=Trichoderma harzianum CBS 226.95 TaxID=983964 RepID=A0A2T3ZRC0_TRIHA|nr:hypothetical protein M431DRAFT_102452 [Trichoderma harzianum CBS 226.95]KAK0761650.1 hypothetical protein N5P37_005702 [Trichoderma harzianum]PKK42133.1 hypothetical protein CI102_14624 [Trichoderma harzianum]PTB47353.1 hypothetical protein M431DRAFT_102452 [Trichoderma harzianum CBS 226.95]